MGVGWGGVGSGGKEVGGGRIREWLEGEGEGGRVGGEEVSGEWAVEK